MSGTPILVLVLGGTAEARELAAVLVDDPAVRVVSSLAGRVTNPRLPAGQVRIGGFGGPEGLARWLAAEEVGALVDATHPFAGRISASAAAAAQATGVPLLALRRPGWQPVAGDRWYPVASLEAAAGLLPQLGTRIFLTTGRQGLAAFAALDDLWFLARAVDPPGPPLPPRIEVLLDRGPYTVPGETALMRAHRIDVVVTKDSGGPMTAAKLTAARDLGLPVVIVRRPDPAPGVPVADSVAQVVAWLRRTIHERTLRERTPHAG